MRKTDKDKIKEELRAREGARCQICLIDEDELLATAGQKLDLDHIDGDKYNNRKENFQLLCHLCNCRKNPKGNKASRDAAERAGRGADQKEMTLEMEVARKNKPAVNAFVFFELWKRGPLPQSQIVAEAAFETGASLRSVENYLKVMVCGRGQLERTTDGKRAVIAIKEKYTSNSEYMQKRLAEHAKNWKDADKK
jgi:hypothetical protein